MKKYPKILALLLLPLYWSIALADSCCIPTSSNWQDEAAIARNASVPLMMVFSSDECNFCDRLKREVLEPMIRNGQLTELVHIREFNMDTAGKIIDFDGSKVRSRMFVSRYDVFATPTVLVVDYQGNPIARPIVGFDGADLYPEHLIEAIDHAMISLAMHKSPQVSGSVEQSQEK